MPNLAKTLNEEIRRLARSEAKAAAAPLQKVIAGLRKTVRSLKGQNAALTKQVAGLTKALPEEVAAKATRPSKPRVTSRSIRAQRKRLGLTIAQFAALVGASGSSIVNWEGGKAKPTKRMVDRLVEIRGLGRRGAKERLKAG